MENAVICADMTSVARRRHLMLKGSFIPVAVTRGNTPFDMITKTARPQARRASE
ncbi:MAG TPA: hypothetical protein VIX73_00950 [Kofleriaceae bacterium]|jgi:hypothetical protein